jgi:prolipoprotein diacylglyceryl transferase
MIFNWNASPEIFSLGPLHLRWYGLMFLLGFSLGYRGMKRICEREGLPTEALDSLLVHLVLGTTLGARLGHCLFYDPVFYLSNPLEIIKIWEGGLASHGGVLGVLIATWIFLRKNPSFQLMWLYDRLVIFTVMTGGFIRIGNLMNSEIIGRPTFSNWGVVFERVDQLPRHPAMLYESIWYFLIFALAYSLYKKFEAKTPSGLIFGFVTAAVFFGRFVIEFVKENQSSFENQMTLNMGQILSLPFIAAGIYLVARALRLEAAVPRART